jgi:hypothetical protein
LLNIFGKPAFFVYLCTGIFKKFTYSSKTFIYLTPIIMKKKTFFLGILSVVALSLRAADYPSLVFTLTDGTTRSITSAGLNLTFSDGNLTATSGSTTITIPLASLTKMEFSTESTTAVEDINADVTLDDHTEVYDLNGRLLANGQWSTVNGRLKPGVYMIKSNGKTTKVQVR